MGKISRPIRKWTINDDKDSNKLKENEQNSNVEIERQAKKLLMYKLVACRQLAEILFQYLDIDRK